MVFGIVEGEPGVFPDPIARILRFVSRLIRAPFRSGRRRSDSENEGPGSEA